MPAFNIRGWGDAARRDCRKGFLRSGARNRGLVKKPEKYKLRLLVALPLPFHPVGWGIRLSGQVR